jgi:hypothetical protein
MELVHIETGISESDQLGSFTNATLQGAGDDIAVSIAAIVSVPESIYGQGEEAVATYLKAILGKAAYVTSGVLCFEVQIGPSQDNEED